MTDFDILINSISAEERSSRVIEIFRKFKKQPKQNLIFWFKEVALSIEASKAKKLLERYSISKVKPLQIECDLFNVDEGVSFFNHRCLSSCVLFQNKKTLLDISTLIKPYFFSIIKLLRDECKISEIYIAYTEPLGYRKPFGERFSFTRGLDHVGEIPSFNGRSNIEKKNLLVILLGFEGSRSLEVLRSVQPDKTIVINGFPAYRPEFKDISLMSNESTIREGKCLSDLQYAPASDPFETYRTIKRLYDDWSKTHNLSIAPLGTKPMALGACLFALQHPEVRILYAYPQGYLPKVAEGYGKTWMYEIFFE